MSLIFTLEFKNLETIKKVANLGAGHDLAFKPGHGFKYSDQGTDTLTAVIEVASGMTAQDFVTKRILSPLKMKHSVCVMNEGNPLRARQSSLYVGSRGNWNRFWNPSKAPLFPFFLGSQGLYSTLEDYAKFMTSWAPWEHPKTPSLLPRNLREKALRPSPHPFPAGSALPGLTGGYGYLMQLWTKSEPKNQPAKLAAFGHGGSDGTHAWVFPEHQAMVLYFTQSRGNTTGSRVEEILGEIFLGAAKVEAKAAPSMEPYLGYYWEGEGDLYRAIIRDGDDMALEILGKAIVPLTYLGEDRWKFRPNPSVVLEFQRSESGKVTGYRIGNHQEFRFEPSAKLPTAKELEARVAKTHGLDALRDLSHIEIKGSVNIHKQGIKGTYTASYSWPNRFVLGSEAAGQSERVTVNEDRVLYSSTSQKLKSLTGARATAMRLDSPLVRLGYWSQYFQSVQVIQQIERGDKTVLIVRGGDLSAPGTTYWVDAKTNRVMREQSMAIIETLGRIGVQHTFGDFREKFKMLLPYRTETRYAHPMIGKISSTINELKSPANAKGEPFHFKD